MVRLQRVRKLLMFERHRTYVIYNVAVTGIAILCTHDFVAQNGISLGHAFLDDHRHPLVISLRQQHHLCLSQNLERFGQPTFADSSRLTA